MRPRFETCDAFRVLGVEEDACKIDKVDPGFQDFWLNKFMAQHDSVQPYSTDGAYYAVWFGTTESDISQGKYLTGMAVRTGAAAPDGWVIRELPAAEYAVFETTLGDVGAATEEALDRWLPASEYELDAPKPRFDFMPPNTARPESPVSVWILVRKRT